MLKSLINNKERVAYILERHPVTRDCDKTLWLAYMVFYHGLKGTLEKSFDPYSDFRALLLDKKVPSFESLARIRRKFQEAGQYVGTKRDVRGKEESEVREWARS